MGFVEFVEKNSLYRCIVIVRKEKKRLDDLGAFMLFETANRLIQASQHILSDQLGIVA